MNAERHQQAPQFIAYVYPGWHMNAYRPDVDEWQLLDNFKPYFAGHLPPLQPLAGRYDDASAVVAARQIALARQHGIAGFIYFTYFGSQGWVLDAPMRTAMAAAAPENFAIAGSWCIRLPHDSFPVLPHEKVELEVKVKAEAAAAGPAGCASQSLEDMPIASLTLAMLEELVGVDDPLWDSVLL